MKSLYLALLVSIPWTPVWAQATDPEKPALSAPPQVATSGSVAIQGPERSEPYKLLKFEAIGVPATAHFDWIVFAVNAPKDKDPSLVADVDESGGKMQFTAPPGKYIVRVVSFVGGEKTEAKANVIIGEMPPVPPAPDPQPTPPTPPPGPTPTPIGDGLRVLIILEEQDYANLPPGQRACLSDGDVIDFLNTNCEKGADGKTPEWRRWDDDYTDDQIALMPPNWQKAYRDAIRESGGKRPYVIISNPKKGQPPGVAMPLPETKEEFMAELQKWK